MDSAISSSPSFPIQFGSSLLGYPIDFSPINICTIAASEPLAPRARITSGRCDFRCWPATASSGGSDVRNASEGGGLKRYPILSPDAILSPGRVSAVPLEALINSRPLDPSARLQWRRFRSTILAPLRAGDSTPRCRHIAFSTTSTVADAANVSNSAALS